MQIPLLENVSRTEGNLEIQASMIAGEQLDSYVRLRDRRNRIAVRSHIQFVLQSANTMQDLLWPRVCSSLKDSAATRIKFCQQARFAVPCLKNLKHLFSETMELYGPEGCLTA